MILFKYFHIIADPEKLSRGRGSEGYLSLLEGGGGVGSMHIFGVFTLDVKFKKFEFSRKGGGGSRHPPLDPRLHIHLFE